MKRIKIYGVLLLALLLAGCSTERLMETGARFLDKVFAGDSISQPASSESSSASAPASGGQEQEDIDFIEAEEPTISDQSPGSTEPDPSEPSDSPDQPDIQSKSSDQPPADPDPSQSSAGTVSPSHTDATLFAPGESFKFLPKGVTGAYACTYTSENETIASVDSDTGKVTAVGPGTTKINMHVECNGQYDFSCIVRCSWKADEKEPSLPGESGEPSLPPVSTGSGGISASHSDATFFNPKEHFQLLPVGAGSEYSRTYSTGNAGVASVDEKGVVTAVGPGTTTITMTLDAGGTEYIFECIVRCNWS